jgi:ABC-2 type transport system permease protein
VLRSVWSKTIRDQRRGLVGWSIGLVAMAAYTVGLYPTVRENAADFAKVFERVPQGLRAVLAGNISEFDSPEGYLSAQFFTLMVPLLFTIFAIRAGSSAIAGEERDGTMDLLLSAPIRRRRLVAEKAAAMLVATTTVGLAFWGAMVVGSAAVGMDISPLRLGAATGSAVLLALAFGSLALAIGAGTGERGPAVAGATAVAVATYLINSLSRLVDALEPWRLVSPFYYYGASEPLRKGLDPLHAGTLATLIVTLPVVAALLFDRRDVAV